MLLSFECVYAGEVPSDIQFVRPLGMGGAFTAVADDHNIFNYNPAGLVQRTGGQLTMLEIALGAASDTKDAYDFIKDNENDLTNFDDLPPTRQQELVNEIATDIAQLNPRIYSAGNVASYVSGPNFLGLPLHVGFGGFYVVDATFKLENGVLIPTISYEVNNDIVLPLSIAHRWDMPFLPGKIGVGLTGKIIQRSQVKQDRLSVIQLEDMEAPPFATGKGFGGDLGILYQPTDRTNLGFMVKDIGGTKLKYDAVAAEKGYPAIAERETVISPITNVGLSMVPKKILWLIPTSDRWTFSADVWDILNEDDHLFFEDGFNNVFGENLYTHLHLGAEYRWWFLRFRGGASEGYPTLGLGLDWPLLKLDYAFYSQELGEFAGDLRQENHVVSVALKFGGEATENRERIKKSKEIKRGGNESIPESAPSTNIPESSTNPGTGAEGVPQ
ncbi:MAG: hypothetical protein KCHDKBKB_00485 [Elusimicrobia bacterium]|nr:hypothetical protein [Elusimicrobiota bacterium]